MTHHPGFVRLVREILRSDLDSGLQLRTIRILAADDQSPEADDTEAAEEARRERDVDLAIAQRPPDD